ncbi:hypothetical protein B0H17DRAFT_949103 [Mycena rosella]|uniref:BTB domain-containing protein n=1 Tax=Mycena rosella TaxID=1033263 RepID=A0AAD7CYS7_MYCRO|nr:hypothetical protein B0H17DRAFT_949103 [Mycena rosella]
MQNASAVPVVPPPLVREDSLWFSDATLIIQAERSVFRVFPGILAAKSPVFHDMLAFPQPENGEAIDGCPVVHLTDSAIDTAYFLKAIFHYDFFEAWPSDVDFHIISGVLRLSQKYQVDPLKKRALRHISERCPSSLDQWGVKQWAVHPILLVNLAREVSADWILPTALASCCWLLAEELVHGVASATGHATLAPSDILLCMYALGQFQTTWTNRVLAFLWTPFSIPGCVSPAACFTARVGYRRDAEDWREDDMGVLDLWDEHDWSNLREDVCGACFAAMQVSHQLARREYWDALPLIFGLPDWDTLLARRAAALE